MTETEAREREIFLNAPADASPEVLAAYLQKACGEDEDLRSRVEALLVNEADAGDFLRHSPLDGVTLEDDAPLAEGPGDTIGNYKLLQQIGEGGFGVVYMAEQLRPVKRRVALKVIKLGMDTRQVVARFEAERQALAMMDHPNIAKVLDAGATDSGRPFFVMELVRGIPITQFCDDRNLDTTERLKLFIEVCRAVQHAHQKGIIHRDLKPTNVLVTMHDDRAVPKVIDFGVAKATQSDLTEKTLYTRFEQFIGTPAYMSPEQAEMSGLDIDTRSDIYALGVLLYELLTGRTPFNARDLLKAGQDEIRRVIREDEPPKPSTRVHTLENEELTELAKCRNAPPERLRSLLRGDLDWIIMMALEKDRTRRYETANGLAADLQRHLKNEPVLAAAPGTFYRLGKYARRNRRPLGAAAALGVLLVVSAALIVSLLIKGVRQDAEIERARLAEQARLAVVQAESNRKQDRVLCREAVAEGNWEVARTFLHRFLDQPVKEGRAGAPSVDRFKLAAISLVDDDRASYERVCEEMIANLNRETPGPDEERSIRVYFSVPRSPEGTRARDMLAIARRVEMIAGYEAWEALCEGIAEFRMGNYAEARGALSVALEGTSLKLQASVRPYLAMTCHHLGEEEEAWHYLRGAETAVGKLEASAVEAFWQERLVGRLAYEEARALIGQ